MAASMEFPLVHHLMKVKNGKRRFEKIFKSLSRMILADGFEKININPEFLKLLKQLNDYNFEQQVKESLFNYNKSQISRNIKNYLFAINHELGTRVLCPFTHANLEITEEYLLSMESYFLKEEKSTEMIVRFRKETQYEYSSSTLPQDILITNMNIEETKLYRELYAKYLDNLKENVFGPLL
ncbi:MAG: hypothetical protein JXQ65_04120 [Candidatus Marinimicrobia bacterium]|nr:hypothetical protein [Candidatus Neomarinimicrobiota bacterium]